MLIQLAWQTGAAPFSAAPDWFSSQGFDIEAASDHPVTWGQMQLMLQSLLESRFRLTFHRLTKEGQVCALLVDKGGLKLPPSPDQSLWTGDHPNEPGTTGADMDLRKGSLTGDKIPLALFVHFLMGETGHTVLSELHSKHSPPLKTKTWETKTRHEAPQVSHCLQHSGPGSA